ncbi:CGNR zinc finger domain-containing protein [Mucilaginibacter sp. HD30]
MTLDGGAPCLDFVNSGYDREKDTIQERLHDYSDLLALVSRMEIVAPALLKQLTELASVDGEAAEDALVEARNVRLTLYRVFSALAHDPTGALESEILGELNRLMKRYLPAQTFKLTDGQLTYDFEQTMTDLSLPVRTLLLSAFLILKNADEVYIKQCAGCEWLFIDKTKNHQKRWCSMRSCGNAEKTKRYYRKSTKI